MSIPFFNKDLNQKVVITPKQHLAAEKEHANFQPPKAVIFCYEKYVMDNIKDFYKVETKKFWTSDIHYFQDTSNEVALVGNFGIGAPASCHLLEALIASGVKNYIMLGHAGGLQKENPIGTIILCDKAIRDEGLSHHYLEPDKYSYPSKSLSEKLEQELLKIKANYKIGSSWTLDSMYRETIDEIKHYQAEGIATVEMEAASMFAVATFRNVELASMFVISDHLTLEEWKGDFNSESIKNSIFKTIDVAKMLLKSHIS